MRARRRSAAATCASYWLEVPMTLPDNPFPPQAVAVYGPEIATTAVFSYMDRVRKALQGYIADYPDLSLALALSGGHGSGKTHLLMWLRRGLEGSARRWWSSAPAGQGRFRPLRRTRATSATSNR